MYFNILIFYFIFLIFINFRLDRVFKKKWMSIISSSPQNFCRGARVQAGGVGPTKNKIMRGAINNNDLMNTWAERVQKKLNAVHENNSLLQHWSTVNSLESRFYNETLCSILLCQLLKQSLLANFLKAVKYPLLPRQNTNLISTFVSPNSLRSLFTYISILL